ncbi:hypothetical protein HC256_005675 [Beauveria bassiana]|nr:hypothetical protein HC256_005675 [Beauveria bassiana]
MSRLRPVAKLFALGLAPAACVGASFALRPAKFDALEPAPVSRRLRQRENPPTGRLSPRIIEQLSRGSIFGFGAGVVIAFFSRTLVFLGGLIAGSLQDVGWEAVVYIIVFIDFYPCGIRAPLDGLGVTLEEAESQLVVSNKALGRAAEVVLRLDLLDYDDILNTNAEVAVLIVAGLIRDDIAWLEGKLAVCRAGTDTHGPLMDVQKRADTVPSAVAEVEAGVLGALVMMRLATHIK